MYCLCKLSLKSTYYFHRDACSPFSEGSGLDLSGGPAPAKVHATYDKNGILYGVTE